MTFWKKPILLASSSARRATLLSQAGIDSIQFPPEFDDGVFKCGSMSICRWVQTLAVLKAQHVRSRCSESIGTILAADTVCVIDDSVLGQPNTVDDARTMLQTIISRNHVVYTGWCLVSLDGTQAINGFEQSKITIGKIDEEEVEHYLCSNLWKGKAGGYNLSERIAASWPITCEGDPTSVMGLPMERIIEELSRSSN